MKIQLCAAALCALFASTNAANAAEENDEEFLSELEQQAYDVGWGAANNYCESLKPGPRGELSHTLREGFRRPPITEQFKRACKLGYDNYIDSNQSCQQRIEESRKYTEMWEARNNTCT
ncbi:hypothetical protein BE17_17570 [Sorangium cellulosum]|uniref:Secreted protein n=1 Tax=Sorangium cellulosum TaxID=56 RepID=A0A150SMJ1_SORCE|nr:hypothetical protein BE17_17570 [Sorangium cellulosum]